MEDSSGVDAAGLPAELPGEGVNRLISERSDREEIENTGPGTPGAPSAKKSDSRENAIANLVNSFADCGFTYRSCGIREDWRQSLINPIADLLIRLSYTTNKLFTLLLAAISSVMDPIYVSGDDLVR